MLRKVFHPDNFFYESYALNQVLQIAQIWDSYLYILLNYWWDKNKILCLCLYGIICANILIELQLQSILHNFSYYLAHMNFKGIPHKLKILIHKKEVNNVQFAVHTKFVFCMHCFYHSPDSRHPSVGRTGHVPTFSSRSING